MFQNISIKNAPSIPEMVEVSNVSVCLCAPLSLIHLEMHVCAFRRVVGYQTTFPAVVLFHWLRGIPMGSQMGNELGF